MEINDLELKHGNIVELKDGRRLLCIKSFDKKDAFINLKSEEYAPVRLRDFMKVYEDYTLQNLLWKRKEKPALTEDEKAVLRSINKSCKWIARDEIGFLYAYAEKPRRSPNYWRSDGGFFDMHLFEHLFQSIKWEDQEPCLISELLED